MANGRYYGGSSPVANQLNFLANTLRGGMQDIGAAELANARLAHEVGDPRNVLARRKASDELAAAEDYEKFLNQPLELEDFTGPNPGPLRREFIASHYLPEMEKYGLSAKGGRFWGKDAARPLTKRDYYSRHNLSKLIMAGVFDQRRGMEDSASRARVAGDTAGAKRWEAEIKKYDSDPRPYLRQKRDFLSGLQLKVRPELQKNVQGYIDAVDKQIAAWKPKPMPKEGDKQTWEEMRGDVAYTVGRIFKDGQWRNFEARRDKPTKEDKGDTEADRLKREQAVNKDIYAQAYDAKGEPKWVDTGTRNRLEALTARVDWVLNWESSENGRQHKITGQYAKGSLQDELLKPVPPLETDQAGKRFIYTREGGLQQK